MPLSVGLILVFMLGVRVGILWNRASRLDRCDRLVKTILELRAELAAERQRAFFGDLWDAEEEA